MADKVKRGRGRPRKVVDKKVITRLAQIGCTDDEIELVLGVSSSTLQNFRETIQAGRANAALSVRRMQFASARKGNVTMQIWLGKQLCSQRDKFDHSGPNGGPMKIDIGNPEENERRIAELLAKAGKSVSGAGSLGSQS